MADIPQQLSYNLQNPANKNIKRMVITTLALIVAGISLTLAISLNRLALDSDYFLDSTVGELAVWMADQAEEEAPESVLGRYAQNRRVQLGTEELDVNILLGEMRTGLVIWCGLITLIAVLSTVGYLFNIQAYRIGFLITLIAINSLIYILPASSDNLFGSLVLIGVVITGLVLLFSADHVERVVGFLVVLSFFTVFWQSGKAIASRLNYSISVPLAAFEYDTFPELDSALSALQNGEITVLLADRNELDELMPRFPAEEDTPADLPYPDLRYTTDFENQATQLSRPVEPALAGRVAIAVTEDNTSAVQSVSDFSSLPVGTIAGSFAEEDFLTADRELILINLKILNDLNLPPLQSIAEALLQPARRNGPLLLVNILFQAAMYTWTEAIIGFFAGAALGFILGSVFAHVKLLQRSLLPYVIASQTIPIIAIAPMIVIWLRDTHPILPVAVISAYLTFFPVTINTLRGLQSPEPIAFDLMNSYAATRWEIMWKLRFPAALPFIFTALKVSATASVVGAIIGELPSGVRNGLGRAILDFSSDYSLISTPKLWAAIFMASLLGIVFFMIVSLIERVILRGQLQEN